ncbi:bifunctional 3-(3-hydroxy-phenyl)propionate/3-hydroxycinnamic acid hydroxylase MhpA [Phenylobacterium ferrooxidans]|uniref:Bifunctional 3-(3-hydroxy-phenyl)propionate/3-hydroxycinnamic acid hydroxylase n=1 Tax=Phenylobacterium ferrooxidans TaxID=2982689 RepID=A0ABW6CMB0_9CAUL
MAKSHDCDVLIVGAGPVGVTLALLLARESVSVIVADKAAEIYPLPRAAHIDHEIVRIFQSLGVAEEIMATSRAANRYDFLTAAGEVLMRFEMDTARTPSGWPASNMIHQPSIEAALRRRLADAANAKLKTEWTFEGYAASENGVTAEFSTPEGPRRLSARYLVGCDGASSTVRGASGAKFLDLKFDEPWLVIDALVHDAQRLPEINLQICDPERPTTCVLMGQGRHRWEFMLKPGETVEQVLDDNFIEALLAPWNVDGAISLERKAVYRFHALVADRWRAGSVLLAGDAAHQMPPFAGQGLCSGVRDAANLAWKLAAVLRGEAGEALLDTYQPEREPHVRAIIDLALVMGRTVCITDPIAAAERDRTMLAQRATGRGPGGAVSYPPIAVGCVMAGSAAAGELFPQPWSGDASPERLDDVLGAGPWLITRNSVAAEPGVSVRCVALTDTALAPFAADLVGWFDRRGVGEAILVRSDRYVFGAGSADTLLKAWAKAQD